MGDIIQKLPIDQIILSHEEKDNFMMLFPEEQPQAPLQPTHARQEKEQQKQPSLRKIKNEVISLLFFVAVFFVLNIPYVKTLLVEYIPMCSKSWIITNLIQAVIFAFVLWIALNAEYSRV